MAEKLSIQIALDGGAEIERQLAGIGEAGTKAFADITKSAEQAGGFKQLDPKDVTAKLQEMGVTGADSIKKIQDAVASAGKLETLVAGITSVETAFAALAGAAPVVGAAIVAAMVGAAKAAIAFAGEINKINDQAIKLGVGIEQVDRFRIGLEKAGVSAASVAQILQSKLAAQQGIVGIERFIQQLEQMPDSAGRSALAIKEFGAAGAELIRILQAGGRLTGFGGAGGLINAEDARKATELGIALNQLESSYNRFNSISLAPALTVGINVVTNAVQALSQRLEQTPWSTWFSAANLGLSPIASLISTISQAFVPLNGQVQQAGQAAQQSGVMFTQWGTVASTAGQQAASAAQLATVAFTSYGTVVEGARTRTQSFAQSLAGIAWNTISSGATMAWNAVVSVVQGAGSAIATFVSSLAGITWDTISSGATMAWNAVVGAIQGAIAAVGEFVSRMATIAWDAISSAGVAAWNALTSAIEGAISAALRFVGIKPSPPTKDKDNDNGGGAPGKASGGLLGGRGTGTSDSNLAWVSRGEFIISAAAVRRYGAGLFAALNAGQIPGFQDGGSVSLGNVGAPAQGWSFKKTLEAELEDLEAAIAAFNNSMTDSMGRIIKTQSEILAFQRWVKERRAALDKDREEGKFFGLLASGGLIGGRGTGRSDSNLAWVSRGEHIMPARAVSQPGVFAFLEALRRSGGNLGRVLDGMGRFALGGMVPRAIPAFAGGGLAGGMSSVTIQFPGLPDISGLRASSGVVDELRKAAALAQVRSGGRKPSRYS